MNTIIAWIRQPSSVRGIALLVFAAVGYALHQLSPEQAWTCASGGAVLLGIPDNTTTLIHRVTAALGTPDAALKKA